MIRRVFLALTTVVLVAVTGTQAGAQDKPNIVFVLTDDLNARILPYLPRLSWMLASKGMTLQLTAPTPVCAPSRASILTGKYAHNHDVRTNGVWAGGIIALNHHGNEERTYAVWLHDAGYTTGHFGKYTNGHQLPWWGVPPGWDAWVSYGTSDMSRRNFMTLEPNGVSRAVADYDTDFFAAEAASFVASAPEPFLAVFSPMSPHGPFIPAPRHRGLFHGTVFAWPPSFDGDVRWMERRTRTRLEMMLPVEEGIEQILGALEARGVLDRTYVFFTSDHGIFMGEHGYREGKGGYNEETTQVPLFVTGPGVPVGTSDTLLSINDLAPTFAELAGVPVPDDVDGRSFAPLLRGEPLVNERKRILLEWFDSFGRVDWQGLRTPTRKYVRWSDGRCKTFQLDEDPYEQHERSCDGEWAQQAAEWLDALGSCSGAACVTLEEQ